jgi:hypothetical protein
MQAQAHRIVQQFEEAFVIVHHGGCTLLAAATRSYQRSTRMPFLST